MTRTAALAAVAALVASCGGGGRHAGRAAKAKPDAQIARDALLTLQDFTTGWEQDPSQDDAGASPCAGMRSARGGVDARAVAPEFVTNQSSTAVDSAVYLYPTAAGARRAFASLASGENMICLSDQVAKRYAANTGDAVQVGHPSLDSVSMDRLGDDRVGARITLAVSSGAKRADVDVDFCFVRTGRGIALMTMANVGGAFDGATRVTLTATAVRRLSSEVS